MRWSLRAQLIAVVLIAGLPSVVVLATDMVQDQVRAEEAAGAEAATVAAEAIEVEQRILGHAGGVLAALAALDPIANGARGSCDDLLHSVREDQEQFSGLAVLDADLMTVCSSTKGGAADTTRLDAQQWQDLRTATTLQICTLDPDSGSAAPVLPLAYPIHKNGSLHRVLRADIPAAYLQDHMEQVSARTGAHILVVDASGQILAEAPRGEGRSRLDDPFLQNILAGAVFSATPTGQTLWYHAEPFGEEGRRVQVYAAAGVPVPDVNIWSMDRVLAVGAAVTALVAVTYLGVERTVQRPSRRLRDATKRFLAGDLDHRVDTRSMPSELAAAGEALNQMAPQMAITQRGLERLVEARTLELERSNRDLEDFAYAASHDLRQPVRSITGYLDLVRLKSEGLDGNAQAYLERARRASLRLQDLIDGLLTYSRVTTDREVACDVDLGQVVHDVVDDLGQQLEESHGRVEVDGILPFIHATPAQARLVLQNLISNGIKFVPPDRAPHIRIRGHQTLTTSTVEVEDNGIGIEQRFAEKVFGMFQRLHPRDTYAGHGIGLAVVKRIVESHGGDVTFQSTPGQGTTFRLTWPTGR